MQILFGLYYVVLTMKIFTFICKRKIKIFIFYNEMPIKFVSWYFFCSEMRLSKKSTTLDIISTKFILFMFSYL